MQNTRSNIVKLYEPKRCGNISTDNPYTAKELMTLLKPFIVTTMVNYDPVADFPLLHIDTLKSFSGKLTTSPSTLCAYVVQRVNYYKNGVQEGIREILNRIGKIRKKVSPVKNVENIIQRGTLDEIKCGRKGKNNPNPYDAKVLITVARRLGVPENKIRNAKLQRQTLCKLIKDFGLQQKSKKPVIRVAVKPQAKQPTPQRILRPRVVTGKPQQPNGVQKVKTKPPKVVAPHTHKRVLIKKLPTFKQWTATRKYLELGTYEVFDKNRCQNFNAYGLWEAGRRFGVRKAMAGHRNNKSALCDVLIKYGLGVQDGLRSLPQEELIIPSQNIAPRPDIQNRTNNNSLQTKLFVKSLPSTHPLFRSEVTKEIQRVWIKLQLTEALTNNDKQIQSTIAFDVLAVAVHEFDMKRLLQEQLNNPNMRIEGLNDPGVQWSPKNSVNVNNVAHNLKNNIFLAGKVPNKAVYLVNDVKNRKVQKVYNQDSLKQWLMKNKRSPMTKTIVNSWNKVKRVPETIMRRRGDSVAFSIKDGNFLNKLYQTQYVQRIIDILQVHTLQNFRAITTIETMHANNEKSYSDLRISCAVYLTMLKEYVVSKKTLNEKQQVLINLEKQNPVCIENVCSTISEFIQQDSNGFVYDFDPKSTTTVNLSKLANALRNSYCIMLNRKVISKMIFLEKMKVIYSRMISILLHKRTTEGAITAFDIRHFLQNYENSLLECPNLKLNEILFKNFKFNYRIVGTH
jgi:hypothetical protein